MRLLTILAILGLSIAMVGSPALAGGYAVAPVIPRGQPNWVPVPGVPGVHYAPNIQADMFRYRGSYYCRYGGRWYQGRAVGGPWAVLPAPPAAFHRIQAPYFKVPPGWARGKKVGWRDDPIPPGQIKNYGFDPGHSHPGHVKKWLR
jgi:hypothetical protein